MKKSELKVIIRALIEDYEKLKNEVKELEEKADKVDRIDEVISRWYKIDGIKTSEQAVQEINDILVD